MTKIILPQGDYIRQLLIKSNVTNSNINSLLREKGVFLGYKNKNNSIPLLMKSIISPNDFNELYNAQKTKEETPKYRTYTIKCKKDFDITEIIPEDIDLNTLIKENHTYKPNFKVIGSPTMYFEDEYTGIFEYEIEREDLLSDWSSNKTTHKGAVHIKKSCNNNIQISVQQNSTSRETIEVNNIITSILKEQLKNKLVIDSNDDIIEIKFNHFDNSNRIKFFYSFIKTKSVYLDFISITDIDLFLDEAISSHEDIKQFVDEIDNLKLKGKGLQNHILLKETKYYPKLIFGAIKHSYKLTYKGIEGRVVLNLSFPDFIKSKDELSEFQISIDIKLNRINRNQKTENKIREELLEIFELKKVESYEKLMNQKIR